MKLRDSAQKMTYAYCLFYCFENAVRTLVAQRLLERKGVNWWDDTVPSNVRKRVENKKAEIENNKWHQATIGADITTHCLGISPQSSSPSGRSLKGYFRINIEYRCA